MDLMQRIPVRDWTTLTYEERLRNVMNLQSLRDSCRRESLNAPTKSATKNKALRDKLNTSSDKPSKTVDTDAKNAKALQKLFAGLSDAQIKSLKQSYGVT